MGTELKGRASSAHQLVAMRHRKSKAAMGEADLSRKAANLHLYTKCSIYNHGVKVLDSRC